MDKEMLYSEYFAMVSNLAKPGAQILTEFTPEKFQILRGISLLGYQYFAESHAGVVPLQFAKMFFRLYSSMVKAGYFTDTPFLNHDYRLNLCIEDDGDLPLKGDAIEKLGAEFGDFIDGVKKRLIYNKNNLDDPKIVTFSREMKDLFSDNLIIENGEIPINPIPTLVNGDLMHLYHMLFGIMGESFEVQFYTDKNNLKEEMGDLLFYLQGFLLKMRGSKVGTVSEKFYHLFAGKHVPFPYTAAPISSSESRIADLASRIGLYSAELFSELTTNAVFNQSSFEESMNGAEEYGVAIADDIREIIQIAGFSVEEVMEANMDKLLKGKNARYKAGSYSDQQAIERADKK